jgi:hypothetical protein
MQLSDLSIYESSFLSVCLLQASLKLHLQTASTFRVFISQIACDGAVTVILCLPFYCFYLPHEKCSAAVLIRLLL